MIYPETLSLPYSWCWVVWTSLSMLHEPGPGHIMGTATITTAEPVSLGGESVPTVLRHRAPHE